MLLFTISGVYGLTNYSVFRFARFINYKFRTNVRPKIFKRSMISGTVPGVKKDIGLDKVRNIGIIAHIDAGKTTTTERMLYYSGVSRVMGEVHDGDTITDYMPQERQRGITITSAAVTFGWKGHRVNLIDTPGHVDFTVEVERALRVMDGAVVILDASAGVEAQTFTVWRQANRYNIPRIIYLNKMDKSSANVSMCTQSIEQKLMAIPLLLHMPLGREKGFEGFVNLVDMEAVTWRNRVRTDGTEFVVTKLDPKLHGILWEDASKRREELVEIVADLDNELAEIVIGSETSYDVSGSELQRAIQRVTLQQSAVPVLCGSSYRNVGVQPLLDAIVCYLPNPTDVEQEFVQFYRNDLCCLAFKIIHNKQKGALTFLRIYSGEITAGQKLYNINRNAVEKIGTLLVAFADDFKEVSKITNGNIAVVSGVTSVISGDTLVSSRSNAENAREKYAKKFGIENEDAKPVLAAIDVPDPVFFCSIESPSLSFQKQLDTALEELQHEDPTLRVKMDAASGQTILSGMGELHIEVIKDRILKEYGVDAYLGPLQVSYREAITESVEETFELNKSLGGRKHFVKITLLAQPEAGSGTFKKLHIIQTKENDLKTKIRPDHLKNIEHGVTLTLSHGPLLGFPMTDVKLKLEWFEVGPGTSSAMITAAASQCLVSLIKKASPCLLEPLMLLEVVTDENGLRRVLADLLQRRSEIVQLQTRQNSRVVISRTPLAELRNYSSALRTMTSGMATFSMELDCYQYMTSRDQNSAIKEVTGFAPSA